MDRILVDLRSTRGRWLPFTTLASRARTTPETARLNLEILRDRGLVYEDTTTTRSPRYLITQAGDQVADRLLLSRAKTPVRSARTAWDHILEVE